MPTVTLKPNGDGTKTSCGGTPDATNLYTNIDDNPFDDASLVTLGGSPYFCDLEALPAEAYVVTSVLIRIRTADSSKGRVIDAVRIMQSDETTAITASATITGSTTATTYTFTPTITGSTSPAVWNSARVRVNSSTGSGFPGIFDLEVEVTYDVAPTETTILTNLSAFWHLDESSGNRADSTANANTLTDTNSVASVAGVFPHDRVAEFISASNQVLSCSSSSSLDLAGSDFSISLWVQFLSLSNNGANDYIGVISKGSGGAAYTFSIQYRPSIPALQMQLYNGGTANQVNGTNMGALKVGQWYHIAALFNNTTKRASLYINSTANHNTLSINSADSSYSLSLGRAYYNNTYNSSCRMAHVALWKRVLTESEIMYLFNNGQGLQYPFKMVNQASMLLI